MLTRPVQEDHVQLSNNQLELQRSYEKEIENSVIKILEPVVGKDKVRAKAFATLDFTRTEKTEEKFDPNSQVVRSEQKNNEKSVSPSTMNSGVPGTPSNLPNKKPVPVASSTGGSTQKQSEVVNYEVSKVVSRVISPSQELKRLSMAIVVDGTYTLPQGSKVKKYTARTDEELKRFEELVKKAVGFSQDRGDEVRVVNMPFEVVSTEELPEAKRDYWPILLSAARYLGPILAFMLIFLFVFKPLTKELLATVVSQARSSQTLALPQAVPEIEKAKEEAEVKAITMSDDVRNWAKSNPDQAASLIKGWTEEA
jgi:flagellar M-ring protein FliF